MRAQTTENIGGKPDPVGDIVRLATTHPAQSRDGRDPDNLRTWDLTAAGKAVRLDTTRVEDGRVTVEVTKPSRRMRGAVAAALGASKFGADKITFRVTPSATLTSVGTYFCEVVTSHSTHLFDANDMVGVLRRGGLGKRSRLAKVLMIGKTQ